MKPEELITYCGIYAKNCCSWWENAIDSKLAEALAELVDASGCHLWMPTQIKDFKYTEFRKGLDFFGKDRKLICKKCCKGGYEISQNPKCEIKKCCQENRLDICFECNKFPCSKVEKMTGMIEKAKEYKRLGKDRWLELQIKKAKEGYELHTGKYYKLWISKH